MLVIGGFLGGLQQPDTLRDPWTNGLNIFDMTALSWSSGYDANAPPYQPAKVVSQYYSANPQHPASWNDAALAAVFATNTSTSTTNGGTIPPPPSPPYQTNAGAIVGGVIGGVVAICIVVALIKCLVRRRSQQRGMHHHQPPYPTGGRPELAGKTHFEEMAADTHHGSMHELGHGARHEMAS